MYKEAVLTFGLSEGHGSSGLAGEKEPGICAAGNLSLWSPPPSLRLINCTLGVSGCILSATPRLAVVSWEAAVCVSGDKDA